MLENSAAFENFEVAWEYVVIATIFWTLPFLFHVRIGNTPLMSVRIQHFTATDLPMSYSRIALVLSLLCPAFGVDLVLTLAFSALSYQLWYLLSNVPTGQGQRLMIKSYCD